jgi:hypothetical protein
MPLRFLEFDLSEDTNGLRTWDALASPGASHTGALLAEVHALTAHLQQALGTPGPVDEGHAWDMDLQIHDEQGQPLPLQASAPPAGRITLALSLSGGAELAARLSAFAAD